MNATPHRIVVVLQAPRFSESSFEPLLRIARRTEARIEGVFVEDTRLLEVAAHPFACFVHSRSHEPSAMDERLVRRAMRVTSVRARDAFAARITATSIPWSFTSRQCAQLSDAFGEATPGDLVVVPLQGDGGNIGQIGDLIGAITGHLAVSLLVLNERGAPGSSILLLFDGDLDDLAAALDLAGNFECRASILAVAGDQTKAEVLAEKARRFLEQSGRSAAVNTLVHRDRDDIEKAVVDAAPGTLVIDRKGATAQTLDIAKLLETSQTSLYLRN